MPTFTLHLGKKDLSHTEDSSRGCQSPKRDSNWDSSRHQINPVY